jgi:uncharacterized protein (TIGR02246 family)
MNKVKLVAICMYVAAIFISCNDSATNNDAPKNSDSVQVTTKPDLSEIKNQIQERETAWGKADDVRDTNAVAEFYADDAISFEADQPMLRGKDAIKNNIKTSLAKRAVGSTTTYEVMDVYGDDHYATEVGKTIRKDSTGKVISTGKYMAVWQNRDGKWLCIRDIANNDTKAK